MCSIYIKKKFDFVHYIFIFRNEWMYFKKLSICNLFMKKTKIYNMKCKVVMRNHDVKFPEADRSIW